MEISEQKKYKRIFSLLTCSQYYIYNVSTLLRIAISFPQVAHEMYGNHSTKFMLMKDTLIFLTDEVPAYKFTVDWLLLHVLCEIIH